jgi:hypothetical protein
MSGTRKMEKFELEAHTKARANEPPAGDAPPTRTEQSAVADLPARPFEPSREDVESDRRAKPVEPRAPEAEDGPGAARDGASAENGAWGEWGPPQKTEGPPSSRNGEQEPDALRTRLARKFVSFADSVTESFRDFAIGAGAWGVELTAPQGMSTAGGKQALQHLRLRPRRQGYSVLVGGTVNQVERRAELRDYEHITIMHEVRFRSALEISRQEWEQFLRKAEVVLNGAGIQSLRTPPPRELLEQRRSMERVSKSAVVALVIVLLLALVVLWRVAVVLLRE